MSYRVRRDLDFHTLFHPDLKMTPLEVLTVIIEVQREMLAEASGVADAQRYDTFIRPYPDGAGIVIELAIDTRPKPQIFLHEDKSRAI